jgi:nicotinamidase-related amidase
MAEKLTLSSCAVVTIDIQMDYFPGGRFPLFRARSALRQTRKLLERAREAGIPVLHIRHCGTDPAGRFLVEGTPGTALHPGLESDRHPEERVIIKQLPNSFKGTDLEEYLRSLGVTRPVFAGMITWMCVDTTVRAAKDLGFEPVLVHDACASGWLLWKGLPVFPWHSQRAFMASLSHYHARVVKMQDVRF